MDLSKAIEEAEQENKPRLEAIVLGPSGSGKSSLLGTLQVKTLYLYTTKEDHGADSARALGGSNVVPVCIDREDGEQLDADAALERLTNILGDKDQITQHGFEAVVIDGASELEFLIRSSSKWEALCKTDKGKHNAFAEPFSTLQMMRPYVVALKELGVHYAVTCILDAKGLGPHGEIVESTPRLQGYSVAESLVQMFGDVVVVGKMTKNQETKHKLQFMTDIVKESKDDQGRVKKCMNFSPRISGLLNLPSILDADLSKVVEMKEGGQ